MNGKNVTEKNDNSTCVPKSGLPEDPDGKYYQDSCFYLSLSPFSGPRLIPSSLYFFLRLFICSFVRSLVRLLFVGLFRSHMHALALFHRCVC